MMNKTSIAGSTLLMLACLTQSTLAQDFGRRLPGIEHSLDRLEGRNAKPRHVNPELIFQRMDEDGDEQVSLSEYTANATRHYEELFARLDRDQSNALSQDELRPQRAAREQEPSIDEIAECLAENGVEPQDPSDRFVAADLDFDDVLNLEEYFMLREQGAYDRFAIIDTDADEQLTRDELAQGLAERKSKRQVRRSCIREWRDSQA